MKRDGRVQFMLDSQTGVPAYRQIIDQVLGGIAAGSLRPGDQLPTVRQLAVDLAINPNTVVRAYRELEIREVLSTQQGTGTFLTDKKPPVDGLERERRVARLCAELLSKAGAEGIELQEIVSYLNEVSKERRT
ncbi:MAG TPA: GntR family transcriptional regulator [Bryobacteraceae bacterium]|nr:GntR family transcriptional regulator [Bryobacteraceae bacterium]